MKAWCNKEGKEFLYEIVDKLKKFFVEVGKSFSKHKKVGKQDVIDVCKEIQDRLTRARPSFVIALKESLRMTKHCIKYYPRIKSENSKRCFVKQQESHRAKIKRHISKSFEELISDTKSKKKKNIGK